MPRKKKPSLGGARDLGFVTKLPKGLMISDDNEGCGKI